MKYSEARGHIRTGDLLAFSHQQHGSWYDFEVHMVRKETESEFSHVAIAWADHGRLFMLEAVSSGVRIFPVSRDLPLYWVPNPCGLSSEALEWAFDKLGAEYEAKWKMVLDCFVDMHLKNNKRWQCSEYVNGILNANDQHLTDIDTPASIVNAAMREWGPLTFVERDYNG